MFDVLSIILILTYHSSIATAWTTVAAVVEFRPSGHCRRGPGYQNDFSRISDGLWKENNVVPFQRFVWGQSQLIRCKKCTSCRVTVLHFSSSPTHSTTHPLPQEGDDQDYLIIDKESRLVNNSDSTRTIHETTSSLFNQVGQFGPKANMLFDSQYFFCLKAVCRSSQICCPSPYLQESVVSWSSTTPPPLWLVVYNCPYVQTLVHRSSPVAMRRVPPRLSDWKLGHGSPDTHVLLGHCSRSAEPMKTQVPPSSANLGSSALSSSSDRCFPEQATLKHWQDCTRQD